MRSPAVDAAERAELERLRQVVATGPTGLVGIDEAGLVTMWNPAAVTLLGWPSEEIVGKPLIETVIPEELREAHAAGMARYLSTGHPVVIGQPVNLPALHRDGRRIDVELIIWPSWVRGQRHFYAFLRDTSAQRASEERLQRQAILLELIPAAIIVRDLDGTIQWWNNGAGELYGWSRSAARGKLTHRLLGTTFAGDGSIAEQTEALTRDGRWEGQVQHLTATGRTLTVLSRQVLHRIAGSDGPPQVLEINTDITAARAAEQALALNEQRFRAQFTDSAAGQVIRALDGTLIAVNKAFAAMVGRHPEDLVGRNVDEELMRPEDRRVAHHRIAALFAGEADSYIQELRVRHADDRWVDLESTVSVVRDPDGRPRHLIIVCTDISARRAAERARDQAAAALAERNAELETADQLKLDIIGMLGHEISNPLSAIIGYSDLLADELAEDTPHGHAVAVIGRHAQRLDDIVREVLAMVTIDTGNLHAVRRTISLRSEVHQILEADGSAHIPVTGDDADILFHPGHLQQILVNLLSNAAKYAGGVTGIDIRAETGRVLIRLADNGPGVPEEFRPHLFDRLTRAGGTASTVKGTGLGLYIVRNLARANNAEVHHEPNPGGGSLFVLAAEPA
ncbi:PAS domain S-box protein [Actinoplanes sp. DH11]|uniref:sensor histidine kinase n=1 Tax=Actinoplanes sp. DH11 TaxID=2857011 RepID=UPI001E35EE5E|nr:PAS domain S-box protein [Actinoplanes sp. DH11]